MQSGHDATPLPPAPAHVQAARPPVPRKEVSTRVHIPIRNTDKFDMVLNELTSTRKVDHSVGESRPFQPTATDIQKWKMFAPQTLPGATVPIGDVQKRALGGTKITKAIDDLSQKDQKVLSKIVTEADRRIASYGLATYGLTADRLKHTPTKMLERSLYEKMKHPKEVVKIYDTVLKDVISGKKLTTKSKLDAGELTRIHEEIQSKKMKELADKIVSGEIQISPPVSTPVPTGSPQHSPPSASLPSPGTPATTHKKHSPTDSSLSYDSRGIMSSEAGPSVIIHETPEDKWAAIQKRLYPSARRSETGMTKMDDDDEEDEDGARIIKRSWDEKPKPTRIVGRVEPTEETKALYERMRGKGKSSKK